jgi:DNA adenine methylase
MIAAANDTCHVHDPIPNLGGNDAAGEGQPFVEITLQPIAQISAAPKLSPFRYPGGKTWLVPFARAWVKSTRREDACPAELFEPFAGGGIISLSMVFEGLVSKATLIERDEMVGSVWATIFSGDGDSSKAHRDI